MVDIVNAIFVQNHRVLLAKRSSHRRNYANTWSFPGGHVKQGETLEHAFVREIQEETTVRPTDYRKAAVVSDPNDDGVRYHIYVVTQWTGGEIKLAGDEHSQARWFSYEEAQAVPDLALDVYRTLFRQLGSDEAT